MKKNRVKVEIITIGDEILIGQIVDTNSAWMAKELNLIGFELAQITSIHDDATHIVESLEMALKRADVVLFTGGLGPTNDDITKQTLCSYFESDLVFDQSIIDNITRLFSTRPNFTINELTRAQAMIPEKCTVIPNLVGTAPIMWFEKEGKIIISMPGVPYEMKQVMTQEIIPRLKAKFNAPALLHKTLLVASLPESALAMKIADWEASLPANVHLAYLPNGRIVKLRLSGLSDDLLALEFVVNQKIDQLKQILGDAIVAYEDLPLEQVIGNLLMGKGKTVATAESCTGGNIARSFTSISGSSAFFTGSVVAYSNDVKQRILHVSQQDLEKYGAVSQQVVEQMAEGVRKLCQTDLAVATSGIAGPGGGTAEKPVGTVWIAASSSEKTISRLCHFGTLRDQNILRATQEALVLLKELL